MSTASRDAPSDAGSSPRRRDVLALLGMAGALSLTAPASSQEEATNAANGFSGLTQGEVFDHARLLDVARALAANPYVAPQNSLPDVFRDLTREQYGEIRALPPGMIWGGEGRGFVVEPLHRGFVYSNPVALFAVEEGVVRRIGYDRSHYDFGRIPIPDEIPDIAFSGFRLYASLGEPQPLEMAVVQGASFFRALARGQKYGTVSRMLTLRPADARGEEFPLFKAFWIERPMPGVDALVVHGLLDSESAVGAVRMTFRPGDVTIVDVELTVIARTNLDHVGIAAMTGSYLFGANDRQNVDDVRSAVYEARGLQIHNGSGEWIWRPFQNPDMLQISAFIDHNPQGFGLLQRERHFGAFNDDEGRWELRPSLWTEPVGEWGEGVVQLIEIPSDSEVNDNILAYWRPKAPLQAQTEVVFAYRQFWCWWLPEAPPLASVTETRVGRGTNNRRRRFLVDFAGDSLLRVEPSEIKATLGANPGEILGMTLWHYPDRKTVRVSFEFDNNGEPLSEMRLVLEAGAKKLSETWLYRWTP